MDRVRWTATPATMFSGWQCCSSSRCTLLCGTPTIGMIPFIIIDVFSRLAWLPERCPVSCAHGQHETCEWYAAVAFTVAHGPMEKLVPHLSDHAFTDPVYISIYIYVYIYMYIYVSEWVCWRLSVLSVHVNIYEYIYILIYLYMYICMCVCMYVCMYVFMYVCANTRYTSMASDMHIFTFIYIYIYICIYTCVYTHVYIYMYIYIDIHICRLSICRRHRTTHRALSWYRCTQH